MFVSLVSKLLGQGVQSGLLAAVEAHGLHMDGGDGHDVGTLLLIEVLQVGQVLEVVGVHGAVVYHGVGHNIVIVALDIQGDALSGQDGLGNLQDLGVGGGGGSDGDGGAVQCSVVNGVES